MMSRSEKEVSKDEESEVGRGFGMGGKFLKCYLFFGGVITLIFILFMLEVILNH